MIARVESPVVLLLHRLATKISKLRSHKMRKFLHQTVCSIKTKFLQKILYLQETSYEPKERIVT